MDHTFTIASDYMNFSSWSAMDDPYQEMPWSGKGYTMMWGVPMLTGSGGTLGAGAAGDYDRYFKILAENLVAAGQHTAILRLGWEFNYSGFPWFAAGEPSVFVKYWRQIVTTMRSVPGQAFRFEWNPARGDNGPSDARMGDYASYYPGNNYVDIIGMDISDTSWDDYPGASTEFKDIQTQRWGLNWLVRFSRNVHKPINIPEFGLGSGGHASRAGAVYFGRGLVSGGDDGAFISEMGRWTSQHAVQLTVYWDVGTSSVQDGRNPGALGALRGAFS